MENRNIDTAPEGGILEVRGNMPVILKDAERSWSVRSGYLDIFGVSLEGGEVAGRRKHLFRAHQGDGIFGMDVEEPENGSCLVAVGSAGIVPLDRQRPVTPSTEDPAAPVDPWEGWIRGLTRGVGKDLIFPRDYQTLEPGAERIFEEGEFLVTPKGTTLWVRHLQGSSLFMGRKDWPRLNNGRLFPLSEGAWLQTLGKVHLEIRETKALLDEGASRDVLKPFHQLILKCVSMNEEKAASDEKARLESKVRDNRKVLKNAVAGLGFILDREKSLGFVSDGRGLPLMDVCRRVGKSARITVEAPPIVQAEGDKKESLAVIARFNRFRTREVILKGDWWRMDNGPLLAFRADSGRPVALIPSGAGKYDLYDSEEEGSKKVDAGVAGSLEPVAQTFYRPFPARSLSVMDVLRTGFHGCSKDLFMVLLMGSFGALLGLLTPVITGIVFDSVIPEAAHGKLVQIALILVACAVATVLFESTKAIAQLRVEGKMDARIQAAVWDRLLSLPVPFFQKFSAGDLANRSNGISSIRALLSGAALGAILGGLFSTFNLALLFYYDAAMALIAIGLSLIGVLVTFLGSYLMLGKQREIMKIEGENSGAILQFITGISKLRVSGTEDRAFAEWARRFGEKRSIAFKAAGLENILAVFNSTFPVLSLMSLFAWMVLNGGDQMTTGKFIAFTVAYANFQNAFIQMAAALTSSLSIFPLYERSKPIFETVPEVDETKTHPGELRGHVEADHLFFRYSREGPLVLKDVSLSVSPGEFVAIVGGSGSGKSTLLRLLLGFEKPESGTIYYDHQDLESIDIREVRTQIGVVLQNGKLMQGDIYKNIVGASGLSIDDAWEAARMVGFDEDIKEMPMGMHTLVTMGGGTLSGGQRQRLLIARAIVRRPRILYFDEATSALDNRTQAIVSRSLAGLQVSRVVIAHRLSTIVNADRICVLQGGELIQEGTYDELMSEEGFFAELARRQMA